MEQTGTKAHGTRVTLKQQLTFSSRARSGVRCVWVRVRPRCWLWSGFSEWKVQMLMLLCRRREYHRQSPTDLPRCLWTDLPLSLTAYAWEGKLSLSSSLRSHGTNLVWGGKMTKCPGILIPHSTPCRRKLESERLLWIFTFSPERYLRLCSQQFQDIYRLGVCYNSPVNAPLKSSQEFRGIFSS